MNDAVRRALRTWLQTFLGLFLISLVGFLNQVVEWSGCQGPDCSFPDIAPLGKAFVAAASSAVVALISYVQNLLEDNTRFPALLKSPPSAGLNPAPDDASNISLDREDGYVTPLGWLFIAVMVILLFSALIGGTKPL